MNSIEKIRVEEFAWNKQMERSVGELRTRVWEAENESVPYAGNPGEPLDRDARHWGAFDGNKLVAAGRLTVHESIDDVPEAYVIKTTVYERTSPIASINRLVVDANYRKRGVGKRLDLLRIDAAEHAQCSCMIAHTPTGTTRSTQLIALGFVYVGRGPVYNDNIWCSGKASEVFVLSFSEGDCLEDAEY